jgi:AcrR family transcriptional regulator
MRMTPPRRQPGRPLDPDASAALLRATLELLDEKGYAGLRVDDVARRAGAGLGALYRRWTTKRELVVAALASMRDDEDVAGTTDDPVADILEGLVQMAAAMTGPRARLLRSLLADDDPELAAAVRQAKIDPVIEANRRRVERVLGPAPDLVTRADIGPAIIVFGAVVLGRKYDRRQLHDEVLPIMLGPR